MAIPVSPTLLPDPTCLHLACLEASPRCITAIVTTISPESCCPHCQHPSTHIHSRYVRQVADLPWMGWAVKLELHVRRFFCRNEECACHIFTERLPSVVASYARRTTRLTDVFTLIGFALGGEAGKRLVEGMGVQTSPDTLLRLIRSAPELDSHTPRVLGVDDFSFRRGRIFGTILVDLEKRIPIDLLPDREATTLVQWLASHSGVEIISRDRGGAYAEGASQGAPKAQQVADRWHLLKNLGEALEGLFLHKKELLKQTLTEKPLHGAAVSDVAEQQGKIKHLEEEVAQERHQKHMEQYHQIHELFAKKVDLANIGRQVGVSRRTVYRYLQMDQPPERKRPRRTRVQLVEPFKPYLVSRWNEGCRNGQQMWREIIEQGYNCSESNVRRFIAGLRKSKGKARSFKHVEPSPETSVSKKDGKPHRPPTALQVARWMTFTKEQRLDWQNTYITRLCEADPVLAQICTLVQDFTTMLRERQGERLDAWLEQVEGQEIVELKNFARGLQKDYDAVKAGLTLEWSQGQVEGQVHRLKLLKRQMYGRGSFQVLRKRVLHRA